MTEWTRQDLEEINELIGSALSNADPTVADRDAITAFRLMRKFELSIQCLEPTCMGTPAPGESPNQGPTARARNAGDDRDAEKTIMPFGKHRGQTLGKISRANPDYFKWLANSASITSPDLAEDIECVCGLIVINQLAQLTGTER